MSSVVVIASLSYYGEGHYDSIIPIAGVEYSQPGKIENEALLQAQTHVRFI